MVQRVLDIREVRGKALQGDVACALHHADEVGDFIRQDSLPTGPRVDLDVDAGRRRQGRHGGNLLDGLAIVHGQRKLRLDGCPQLRKGYVTQEEDGLLDAQGPKLEAFFQRIDPQPFRGCEQGRNLRHTVAVCVRFYDGARSSAGCTSLSDFLQVVR